MVYYDHAILGATLAVGVGAQRRQGWPIVILAALAGMFPDWDALSSHISPQTYRIGHRVWGHNLFAATFAGILLGWFGYWISQSGPKSPNLDPKASRGRKPPELSYWIVLCVLIMWSHPLLDFLYCGWDRNVDWPVGLLWPIVPEGYGRPWMPWNDWGATAILLGGLFAIILVRRHRQITACVFLALLASYVAIRGATVQWG
jgi:membrane-bound metal-dependent hydrolase YbcI (DUF457 family)